MHILLLEIVVLFFHCSCPLHTCNPFLPALPFPQTSHEPESLIHTDVITLPGSQGGEKGRRSQDHGKE